jgi:hypothetical protein
MGERWDKLARFSAKRRYLAQCGHDGLILSRYGIVEKGRERRERECEEHH